MAEEKATRGGPWVCVGSLVLLPPLVKLPLLLGWLIADPAFRYAELSNGITKSIAGHAATLDPNVGYTSQALGTYAARAAAAGQSLWWNPLEGLGTPLAGEMQSAALFPPTLLLLLPNGQLLEHLLFQIVAALATFALLRQLGVTRTGAWLAGLLFGFNGVFAWIANAVVNPVCFLPVMLLGMERLRSGRPRSGSLLLAGGLAGSIYAGFPEVAYLDGLLIGLWVLCRAWAAGAVERWRFIATVIACCVAGLLLSAPLLVAFADLLATGNVGVHNSLADAHLPPGFALSVLVPYFLGNLGGQEPDFWGNIGGYAGLCLTALAIAGALGSTERLLRLTLAGWAVLTIAIMFGAQPLLTLFHLIPLTGQAAVYRYLDASWIMAMCTLAGMALDDARADGGRRVRIGAVAVLFLVVGATAMTAATGLKPGHSVTTLGSAVVQAGALLVIAAAASFRLTLERRRWVIAAAAAIEAIALFAAPIAATPYRAEMDLSGVAFLRAHLGFQRFVTLGPIAANYGSFFGIAQVNHNDLPVPRDWVEYARRHLDPEIDPIVLRPRSPSRLLARLPAYGALGTRFVVAPVDRPLPLLAQVHVDRVMRIYAVPATQPYLSAPGCMLRPLSRTEAVTSCSRPSRLRRLELFMPGWTATVKGHAGTVERVDEVFQAVAVPTGVSLVRFRFVPPGMTIGYLLAAAGLVLLVVLVLRQPGRLPVRRHGA